MAADTGVDDDGLLVGTQRYGNVACEDPLSALAAEVECARPAWFGAVLPVHVTKGN